MRKTSDTPRTVHQLFDLSGKTALVPGGSRGLGLQMARALGEAGARLMLRARLADALKAACADLQKLVLDTLQRMGDIDILVNSTNLRGMAPLSQLVGKHITGQCLLVEGGRSATLQR